jgi:hypothetical protein
MSLPKQLSYETCPEVKKKRIISFQWIGYFPLKIVILFVLMIFTCGFVWV